MSLFHQIAVFAFLLVAVGAVGLETSDSNCLDHARTMLDAKTLADYKSYHESCEHDKTVEIIQVDSRPLDYQPELSSDGSDIALDANTTSAHYNVLFAAVNYLYAQRHGYKYRYVTMHLKHDKLNTTKAQYCEHPVHGQRSAPWCKLLGIYDRIKHRTADEIMFVDTDAMFLNHSRTLDDAMNEKALLDTADPRKASFVVATDFPYNQLMGQILMSFGSGKTPMIPVCTAIMVFRPNPYIDWFFSQWWNTVDFSRRFATAFPFEQGTLAYGLLRHDHLRKEHTSMIDWQIMGPIEDINYIQHVHSGMDSGSRLTVPIAKLKELGIKTTLELDKLLQEIRSTSMVEPNIQRLEEQLSLPYAGIRTGLPLDCCDIPYQKRHAYCFAGGCNPET
eukprot:m.94166 g.94166  ORF g.94166 m.94166 type:complete len:391 (-) comp26690_c0_seq1:37-1209(-)